jgi:hypothetical protein
VNAAESIKQKASLGGRRRYGSIQPIQAVQAGEPHDPAHGRAGGAESRCAAYHPRPSPTSGASLQVYKRAVRASEGPPRFIPRDGARRRGEGFQAFQAFQADKPTKPFQRPSMNLMHLMDSPPPLSPWPTTLASPPSERRQRTCTPCNDCTAVPVIHS